MRRGSLCNVNAPLGFPFLEELLNLAPLAHGRNDEELKQMARQHFAEQYSSFLIRRAQGTIAISIATPAIGNCSITISSHFPISISIPFPSHSPFLFPSPSPSPSSSPFHHHCTFAVIPLILKISELHELHTGSRRWSLSSRSRSPLTEAEIRESFASEQRPDAVKDLCTLRRSSLDFEPDLGSIVESGR